MLNHLQKSLRDMCERRRANAAEFLAMSGVGESKLEKYGEAFIQAIQNFAEETHMPS